MTNTTPEQLAMARRIAAADAKAHDASSLAKMIVDGECDDTIGVRCALAALIETSELEVELRKAVQTLRNGYADAAAGLAYVLQFHGRLSGVGFDRVADAFFENVTMPEREGLLAGSHVLPALRNYDHLKGQSHDRG